MMIGPDGAALPDWMSASWETRIDVRAPPPPTALSATHNIDQISVEWQPTPATDLAGYDLHCVENNESDASERCTSALVPGQVPDENTKCAELIGQYLGRSEVPVSNRNSGYAVAMAAVDHVRNVSELSEVACVGPYEDTLVSGGCFCSVRARRTSSASLVAFGALLALALTRRRSLAKHCATRCFDDQHAAGHSS